MPTEANRHEVQQLIAAGAQLVEVLPADEFAAELIAGAQQRRRPGTSRPARKGGK
jgi:hypothetical protein